MDVTTLRNYIGASTEDDAFIEECLKSAVLLVNEYCGASNIPTSVKERCYLEVGSELYHRRSAPLGIAQYATFDQAPARIARDPLVGVYPILDRYIVRFA